MANDINPKRVNIQASQSENNSVSLLYNELADKDVAGIVGGLYLKQGQSSRPFRGNDDDDGDDDDDHVPDTILWDIDGPD